MDENLKAADQISQGRKDGETLVLTLECKVQGVIA